MDSKKLEEKENGEHLTDSTITYQQTTVTEEMGGYNELNRDGQVFVDFSYTRTLPGIVKLVQLCVDFTCLISVLAGGPSSFAGSKFGVFVTSVAFVVTLTLLVFQIMHVIQLAPAIPWTVMEMIYCFVWTLFYFIAASILCVAAYQYSIARGWFLAAFLGYAAVLVYAFDCFLKFRVWKADIPQHQTDIIIETPPHV